MTSNPYHVVIDDSDSQVTYTGPGWFPHNSTDLDDAGSFSGTTYLHTSHGTNISGSLSFSFQGTEVRLMGTNNQKKNISGVFDPKWVCSVDNLPIEATKPAELVRNNWELCKTKLTDGPHTITLNVTSAGQTFWFDRIEYLPTPTSLFNTVTLLVNNHDGGVVLDSRWRYTSTTVANMTQTYGSTATFNFTGTRLDWVGIIPKGFPNDSSSGTYAIDGGLAIPFDIKGLPGMTSQTFFSTPDLPAGPHSLLVTYLGNGQQMPLTFDYMYLSNVSFPGGTSTNSSTMPGPAISGTGPTSVPQSPTRGTPVGAIIGGVVGGTGALVILICIFLWWRRRRAHARSDAMLPDTNTHIRHYESGVTPYTYSTSSNPTSGYESVGAPQTSWPAFHKSRDLRPLQRADSDVPPRYTAD